MAQTTVLTARGVAPLGGYLLAGFGAVLFATKGILIKLAYGTGGAIAVDAVTLLATGVLFFAGHLIINVLYDPRYYPAGHMIEILSIGLFELRYSVAGQCFMALGKPQLLLPIIAIQAASICVLMPLAFVIWGFEGALWVAGGSVLLTIPMTLYFKFRLGLFDGRRELLTLPWLAAGLAIGWAINRVVVSMGWFA